MSDRNKATSQQDYESLWNSVIARAQVDPAFRQQVLADPKTALQEMGVVLPEGVRVVFHEFDPYEQHITLPPSDAAIAGPAITRIK
jgi:hypothetical protein